MLSLYYTFRFDRYRNTSIRCNSWPPSSSSIRFDADTTISTAQNALAIWTNHASYPITFYKNWKRDVTTNRAPAFTCETVWPRQCCKCRLTFVSVACDASENVWRSECPRRMRTENRISPSFYWYTKLFGHNFCAIVAVRNNDYVPRIWAEYHTRISTSSDPIRPLSRRVEKRLQKHIGQSDKAFP